MLSILLNVPFSFPPHAKNTCIAWKDEIWSRNQRTTPVHQTFMSVFWSATLYGAGDIVLNRWVIDIPWLKQLTVRQRLSAATISQILPDKLIKYLLDLFVLMPSSFCRFICKLNDNFGISLSLCCQIQKNLKCFIPWHILTMSIVENVIFTLRGRKCCTEINLTKLLLYGYLCKLSCLDRKGKPRYCIWSGCYLIWKD